MISKETFELLAKELGDKEKKIEPSIAEAVEARLNIPWAADQIRRNPKGFSKFVEAEQTAAKVAQK